MCKDIVKTFKASAYVRKENLPKDLAIWFDVDIYVCKCGDYWVKSFSGDDYIKAVREDRKR